MRFYKMLQRLKINCNIEHKYSHICCTNVFEILFIGVWRTEFKYFRK